MFFIEAGVIKSSVPTGSSNRSSSSSVGPGPSASAAVTAAMQSVLDQGSNGTPGASAQAQGESAS